MVFLNDKNASGSSEKRLTTEEAKTFTQDMVSFVEAKHGSATFLPKKQAWNIRLPGQESFEIRKIEEGCIADRAWQHFFEKSGYYFPTDMSFVGKPSNIARIIGNPIRSIKGAMSSGAKHVPTVG